jgi:SAM-dependent methyltransferase
MIKKVESEEDLTARARAHYDAYPLEFLSSESVQDVRSTQPRPFREFCEQYLKPTDAVLDAGCGPGRALPYLESIGVRLYAADLSGNSLALAKQRSPRTSFAQTDALRLPFRDAVFDAVCSDGVLHHTASPARGLSELARILRPQGLAYVAVYKRWRHYFYLYHFPGELIRALDRLPGGKLLINAIFLPVYYGVHQLKSGGRRSWQGARNFFYDYFVTPRASFHTRSEIEQWGTDCGLELLLYDRYPESNVHAFVFRKR